jgi:predicted pyridoxine 5'-phosphate oxidase superfamily flavin-nucleotide-binding protein
VDPAVDLPEALTAYRPPSRLVQDKVIDRLDRHCRDFIALSPFATRATADAEGWPDVSPRGGDPGFVRVLDEHTVAFPNYDGNGLYLSMGNVLVHADVGMLFIDFERGRRMRLNGEASVDAHDPLMAEYPEAQFIVRVRAREVFPNCPRYIHKYQLVERSTFVPHAGCVTPLPDWKRSEGLADVLPRSDQERLKSGG